MRVLLVTAPFTQLNTAYPATTVLKAYLQTLGHEVHQCDMSILAAEQIFSKKFLTAAFSDAFARDKLSFKAKSIASNKDAYLRTIEPVWRFLSGRDNTLATRITLEGFLPRAVRFKNYSDDAMEWAYGTTGTSDKARHIATLYIEDLADFLSEMYSPRFELVRYGESISLAAETFDTIQNHLDTPLNPIDIAIEELFKSQLDDFKPDILGLCVPFPGCLYSALRLAQASKKISPETKIVMGGGFVNTELRQISDPRIFDYIDFITFDDGELPLERLCAQIEGKGNKELVRTAYLNEGKVVSTLNAPSSKENIPFAELPAPDFGNLDMSKYISLTELTNPMHKLWSDGTWNKMTVAHGCYWGKCAFCDTSLDYICRYEAPSAATVVDRMEHVMTQTGISGFHFTDEALPPALLKDVATEILNRNITVSFWGNIRFEKSFTAELCSLLAEAGCIAVSGGLEVASPRILKMINKGVTIDSAATVASNFADAGIMVHTYLMYGFPTQTIAETVDSLEIVRQMFEEGIVQSAFWHRLAMTVHSPLGINPQNFGAERVTTTPNAFANNGVEFIVDETPNLDTIGKALSSATYNYMHGNGYDIPMSNWFGKDTPRPSIKKDYVYKIINR